ncbi:spindle assembly checkpoint component Mad1 [Melampsora americana]|nr:spindle assembly checkpoint component Mad1 [Melampsora americana]
MSSTPLEHSRQGRPLQRKPSVGRLPVASSRIPTTRVLRARSSSREPQETPSVAKNGTSNESTAKRPTLGSRVLQHAESAMTTPAGSRHFPKLPPSTKMTTELNAAQDQIRTLEKFRDGNEFEREVGRMSSQLDERETRLKKVENDRNLLDQKLQESQKDHQNVVEATKKQLDEANLSKKSALEQLQSMKELTTELEQKTRMANHNEARAKQSALAAEERAQTLTRNMEEMQKQLASTQKSFQSSQEEVSEVRKELNVLRDMKGNEQKPGSGTPTKSKEILREELSRQVDRLKLLEQTNVRLTQENRSLTTRLSAADELRRKLATIEVEREKLLQEKSEWTVYLEKNQDVAFSSPHELSKALATIRIENATLQERLGSREAQMKSRDRMIAELEARLQEAERERDDEYATRVKTESQVAIAERNRGLDKRRIQMLTEQLKSYTAEEKLLSTDGTFDQQNSLKELAQLKKEREESKQSAEPVPKRPAAVKASLAEQIAKNEALDLELDELAEENRMLQLDMESLKRQVHNLERDLGRGEYNNTTTQVLAPDGGPLQNDIAIRIATLQALKAENKALLSRISSLEKGLNQSTNPDEGLVPRESLVSLRHEIERLEAELSNSIKSRRRLNEMYEEGTKAYRKAMKEILGYSLEAVSNGEFRLRSMFKDESAASMLFVPGKADGGSLEYKPGQQVFHQSREVVDSFHTWLESRKSLPCFTAAITLELYESSTRGQMAGYRTLG